MWAHSKYYGLNSRMITLFRMINNLMIENCTKFLDPTSIFQGEPDESLGTIARVIKILELHRDCFKDYRDRLPEFKQRFCPTKNPILWTFKPVDCFERFNAYLDRLYTVRDIFETANEFYKLEKLELGGLKGRNLSRSVAEVFNDFKNLYLKWSQIQFDPLDPSPQAKSFDNERKKFKCETDVLERKLSAVLSQAFDECYTMESIIKLIEVCGSLLQRQIIFNEIRDKLESMIGIYNNDLDQVKSIYDDGLEKFTKDGVKGLEVDKSFPPVAGSLTWIKKMKTRITKPQDELRNISEFDYIFDVEEGVETKVKLAEMIKLLDELDFKIFKQWTEQVPDEVNHNMKKFLIKRLEDGFLELNFDFALVEALKEVKNLQSMKREGIPDVAIELFENSNELWVS